MKIGIILFSLEINLFHFIPFIEFSINTLNFGF